MRSIPTTAPASSLVVLAAPGLLINVSFTFDAAAAAATYFLILLDTTAVPDNGSNVTANAHGTVIAITPFTHAAGSTEDKTLDYTVPGGYDTYTGIKMGIGCVAFVSSTAPTSITAAAVAWINGGIV